MESLGIGPDSSLRVVSVPHAPEGGDHQGAAASPTTLTDDPPILQLMPELLVIVLEQLPFDTLLAARATCARLRAMALCITRAVLQRKEQLCVPLLLPFGDALLWLELEGVSPEWLPRLGCVLGVLPKLQRLFIRRVKPQGSSHLPLSLGETATLAIAGALQAGACRSLHHLNIDERLAEDKVLLIARSMHPNGGLLFGASHGYESVIDEMLRRGASSEVTIEDGANALIVACYHGGAPVTRLLAHGADVGARRHDGVSALIMASNRGHAKTVEALLDARADVNLAMRDGTTALHTATYKGHTEVVAALIRAGALVQARCHDGVAALLMAAKSGRDELVRMLLKAGADVEAALRDGGTPLLAAAYKGHDACVEALLQYGASVDAARADGLTPLCQASKAGHVRCVELLLEGGANVEAAGAVYGTTSLLMASKGGHAEIVEMLLRFGADTEVAGRAYGTTSLVAAAQHGHALVVSLLLRYGADPRKTLIDGSTALTKAREAGHQEVAGLCTFDDGPGSKGSAHWKPIKSPTFDQSSLTLAVAFDATGKVGFAPGGTHTGGSEVIKSVDGGSTWSKVYPAANGTAGLDLYLAAATRSLTSSVISGVTSQLYTTDGVTFSKSANGLLFPAQDAHVLPDGGDGGSGPFAIVGSSIVLTSQNGVATSTDGKKWSFHKIGLSSKGYGARYGAFPTETTWYVTAGSWGDKQEAPDPRRRHLSKHVSVAMDNGDDGDNTMDVGFHYNDEEEDGSLQAGNASGWKTAIMKTTDGGVSFTQVYSHDDAGLYPNGIGCASASHCIAALEGLSSSILVTRDGGVTWKVAMHDPDKTSSLTVVKMIDDKEAWVMGGKIAFSGFEGRFWHTLDGGDTWTKETIPGLYIMSANFVSSAAGFAVAITKASGVELLKYRATNATISLR